jgi:hypothetical protein
MNEDIREMIDKVKNFKYFINENYNINYGVDFVYNQHPNLSEIGTKEQYSKYIDTIFPNSMNKNIWFHGTNVNPNEIKSLRPSKSGTYGFGIYLQSHAGKYHTGTFGDNTISVIVDVNKIYDFDKYGDELIKKLKEKYDDLEKTGKVMVALQNTIRKEGYDSIIASAGGNSKYLLLMDTSKTFMGPSNHHILGSEKDIENFKLYMSKK